MQGRRAMGATWKIISELTRWLRHKGLQVNAGGQSLIAYPRSSDSTETPRVQWKELILLYVGKQATLISHPK